MKIRRIGIFLPKPTFVYENMLPGILEGFRSCGVEAEGCAGHLGEQELHDFCKRFRPDAVFEMNRLRPQVPSLPPSIRHVAWVVDTYGKFIEELEGSDLTYFFCPNYVRRFPPGKGPVAWLPPGFCPKTFHYGRRSFQAEISFIGHMPKPWSREELERQVVESDGRLTFKELLGEYEKKLETFDTGDYIFDDFYNLAESIVRERFGSGLRREERLTYDISNRTIRMFSRTKLIDEVLAATTSLALYGPENWREWPAYQAHYQRPIVDEAERRALYQASRLNLHENIGLHFRTLDCMGSGGILFFQETPDDGKPGGIRTVFEEGRHYVSFASGECADKVKYYAGRDESCRKIQSNAAAVAGRNHTWRHRAQQVLRDLAAL